MVRTCLMVVVGVVALFALSTGCGELESVCPTGQSSCDGACTPLDIDPDNCGVCGNACGIGEVCSNGACDVSCGVGLDECGGACVATDIDPSNCGACGVLCSAGEDCIAGVCRVGCGGSTPTLCGDACVDTTSNSEHCGGCSSPCAAGEVCSGGACGSECSGDTPTACGAECVNTDTNSFHCGGCDSPCASGEVCSGGACGSDCGGDTPTLCGDECVNTDTDTEHCGGCGMPCDAGEFCTDGSCGLSCSGSTPTPCGDECVNTDTNPEHCGGCDAPCDGGEVCSGGSCAMSCGGSTPTLCGDACVDTTTNRDHCSGCDSPCDDGEVCIVSTCMLRCPEGLTECDDTCVDTMYDPAHCGGCSSACDAGEACYESACYPIGSDETYPWDPGFFPLSLGGASGFGDLAETLDHDLLSASSTNVTEISRADGSVTTLATGVGVSYLLGVVYRPADGLIYLSDSPGNISSLSSGGTVTSVTSVGDRVHSLSIAPAGFGAVGGQVIATVRDGRVVAIDPSGPTVTTLGTTSGSLSDHVFGDDGTLYVVNNTNDRVETMTSAGVFSTLATGLDGIDGVVIDNAGGRLFVSNSGAGNIVAIDTTTGAATTISAVTLNFGDNVTGMHYDGVSTLIYRHSSGDLYSLTP